MRKVVLAGLFAFTCVLPGSLSAAELKQNTAEAFNRYVRVTENRMTRELGERRAFLWVDGFPEPNRDKLYAQLRQGEIIIEQLETLESAKHIKVPDGLIHHWIAVSFIPGVSLQQTLALLQDYDRHQTIYNPDILRSKILSTDGNHFKVYMRLHRKAIVTAVFNAEFDVTYFPVDEGRIRSQSYSTRIAEVENADRPDEREKSIGNDHGYLWRLNSYWRFQERDGGVYVQVESVALSRSVPTLLAWLVNPLLKRVPREYLSRLLGSTRTALANKNAATAFGTCLSGKQPPGKSFLIPRSDWLAQNGRQSRLRVFSLVNTSQVAISSSHECACWPSGVSSSSSPA